MKLAIIILLLSLSLSVSATETHLVCEGQRTTHVIGAKESIAPDINPITITFDDKKESLQSELLFPACGRNQEQIDACLCTFAKSNISCKGLSRNTVEPKNIWYFNFNLDRISGKLEGVRQFSGTGDTKTFSQNSYYNYICKLSPIKF